MRTQRIVFEQVSIKANKAVKCAGGCGRRITRTKKFMQTLNPFNKRKTDGQVKTREDIYPELQAEAAKWKEQPETCLHCRIAAAPKPGRARA